MHARYGPAFGGPKISASSRSQRGTGASHRRLDGFKLRRGRGYEQLRCSSNRADRRCTSRQRYIAPGWQPEWERSSGERNFASERHDRNLHSDPGKQHYTEYYIARHPLTGQYHAGHDVPQHDYSKHHYSKHQHSRHVSFYQLARHDSAVYDAVAEYVPNPGSVPDDRHNQRLRNVNFDIRRLDHL